MICHTKIPTLPRRQITKTSDKFGFDTLIADARMMVGGYLGIPPCTNVRSTRKVKAPLNTMQATACRRSGLKDGEGIALYKLGMRW